MTREWIAVEPQWIAVELSWISVNEPTWLPVTEL
ncbi:hypothetical protein C7459_10536 [Tumebacillus permanentifrigoris]|uniref:Uncharacterized protein n=1 Tax=Tumebacillus permanentifrigoris TaxID=378543 RepID=A0A316DB05_9BACL|nr:hypothetical protein C7459_10536 [Tumebacillus permanentifrigoris]